MVVVRVKTQGGGTLEVTFSRVGEIFGTPEGGKKREFRPRLTLTDGLWDEFTGIVKDLNTHTGNRKTYDDVLEKLLKDFIVEAQLVLQPPEPPKKQTKPKVEKTLIHDKKKGYRYKTEDDD